MEEEYYRKKKIYKYTRSKLLYKYIKKKKTKISRILYIKICVYVRAQLV